MKYLCLVYSEEKKPETFPDDECVAYDEGLRKSGHCIASEALQPVQTAITARVRNGKVAMLGTPQITQTAAQLTAIIRLTVPREEIRNVMGPGIGELMAAIAAQGIAPAGSWFNHHLKMDPAIFDFEISVPVTAPVAAVGRVKPSQWPAMKVARTIYHGAYDGLGAAWGEFDAWIAAKGHTPGPDLWECYVTGPESNPDPATWRTELNRTLRSKPRPLLAFARSIQT